MKIGIYANFLIFETAGVGKYSQNLARNLFGIDQTNQYFLYFSFLRRRKEREKLIGKLIGKHPNVKIKILPIPASWFEWLIGTGISIKKFIREDLDIFYSPYPSGIPKNGFPRMITTIHDLVFMRFPEHRGRKLSNYYLRRHKIAISKCQKLIVPSYATKKDLEDLLGVAPKKIAVIPEAADKRFKVIKNQKRLKEVIKKYFNPDMPYFLSVGTLEPRKNLACLVESYAVLPNQMQRTYRLVIAGGKGWNNDSLLSAIENYNLRDKVILPGFVSDEDLPYIYNGASIFIYPSLYEGFGLPPLEALACGTPVIAAKTSSIPEVVGDAGILVDVQDEKEIVRAIKKVLLSVKLRQKLTVRGLRQAKKFSWAKAAKETLKVFKSLK